MRPVPRRTRLAAAVTVTALLPVLAYAATPAVAAPAPAKVSVWLTDLSARTYLSPQSPVTWAAGSATTDAAITVDSSRAYQPMVGFGASFTDSSAWLVGTKLAPAQRDALMRDLFSRRDGIGLSFLRQPMAATDFTASGNYSYDDLPAGQSDPTLTHFTVDHDRAYTIPLLRQARRINPQLTVMATPWSPPGWMKTTDSMVGGQLKPEAYQPLANYFAKFLEAYAAAGVPVRYLSTQNEPLFVPAYPGMSLPADQQATFIRDHLAPTLRKRHLTTGILGYDHNWDVIGYPETLYADPATAATVTGTAWHCYVGNPVTQTESHNDYPNKPAFLTECSGGNEASNQAAFALAVDNIINPARNWAQSVVRWNMALDPDGGPRNNGCTGCRGVVTITPTTHGTWTYTPTVDYWALAQASKFVQPGARRIASNTLGKNSIQDVAFTNPDGSTALVTYNAGTTRRTFTVGWGNRHFAYTLDAGAAATFTWTGRQSGNTDPAAIGSVDIAFANPDRSRAVLTYDSSLLAQQSRVRLGNRWFSYTLPTGAALSPPTGEVPLSRDGWRATASSSSSDDPSRAVDGDPTTRWSSGKAMQPGDWFQLDLGATRTFNQLVLDTSGSSGDFVRQYEIYASDDGSAWGNPIATGPGSAVTRILLPTTTARYLRVVDTAESGGSWWSIHELSVSSPDHTPAVPAAAGGDVQRKDTTLPDGTPVTAVYNSGHAATTFDVPWAGTAYHYRLPAGAATIFATRPA